METQRNQTDRRRGGIAGQGAFTVIELLAATAVFILMITLLLSAVSQINNAWQTTDAQKTRRERARTALDLIARDLQCAVTPMPGKDVTPPLSFLMNPEASLHSRDTIFWRTLSPANRSASDIVVVGYFVNDQKMLCRFQTNTSLTYGLEEAVSASNGWTPDRENSFRGLLTEGVLGLFVTLFNERSGTTEAGGRQVVPSGDSSSYRSSLPASAEISLVIADPRTLKRNPDLTVTWPLEGTPEKGVQVFTIRVDLPAVR